MSTQQEIIQEASPEPKRQKRQDASSSSDPNNAEMAGARTGDAGMTENAADAASTLALLQRGMHVPPHPILDAHLVDVNIIVDVLNVWLDESDWREQVSFALLDARLAWSLYHRIKILTALLPDELVAWQRRLDATPDTGNDDDDLHFVPRFRLIDFDLFSQVRMIDPDDAWSDIPARLRARIDGVKMDFEVGAGDTHDDQEDWMSTYAADDDGDDDGYKNNSNVDDDDGDDDEQSAWHLQIIADLDLARAGGDGRYYCRNHNSPVDEYVTSLSAHGPFGDSDGPQLGMRVVRMPRLRELVVTNASVWIDRHDGFSSRAALYLSLALRYLPQLQKLKIGHYRLGRRACYDLARALRHVPSLQELNLVGNRLGTRTLRALAQSMLSMPNLRTVQLEEPRHPSWGPVPTDGYLALAAPLQQLPHLSKLEVDGESWERGDTLLNFYNSGEAPLVLVAAWLYHVPQLTALHLCAGSDLNGCHALAATLQRVPQLTDLQVAGKEKFGSDHIHLGPDAWCVIAPALQHVPRLTSLVVTWVHSNQ